NLENNHASDHAKHIQAGLPEGHGAADGSNSAERPPPLVCKAAVVEGACLDTEARNGNRDALQQVNKLKGYFHEYRNTE
ncbi:MAG: hypothetical protein O2945_18175, partial [Planctomycetota bacterium]|nr:hypothetical protein [Planctomycetota bacterium]